jgi:Cu/Ag efflux protein CusF
MVGSLAACTSSADNKAAKAEGPAAAVETKTFQAVGTVKALDPKLPSIEIDHEDIKGLMPAMQMWFHVKDASLINGVNAGDRVEFSIESGVGGLKIVGIKKV